MHYSSAIGNTNPKIVRKKLENCVYASIDFIELHTGHCHCGSCINPRLTGVYSITRLTVGV